MIRLKQCSRNPNHWYSAHAQGCPWCALNKQYASDSFPPQTHAESPVPRIFTSHEVPEKIQSYQEIVLATEKPPAPQPASKKQRMIRWGVIGFVVLLIIVIGGFTLQTIPVSAASVLDPTWSSLSGAYGRPAISSDGQNIVDGDYSGNIHYFDRDGDLLWTYPTGGEQPVVALSSDGQYVAAGTGEWGERSSGNKKVSYLNKDGTLLWSYATGRDIECIALSSDGNYIAAGTLESQSVGVNDNKIYLFSRDGKLLWEYTTSYVQSVAISEDGRYIAATSQQNVLFFSRDGKLLWSSKMKGVYNFVAISADGQSVFVGSYDNSVYYFTSDGTQQWSSKTGDWVESVSLSADGQYAAAGSRDKRVYFFTRDGSLLWSARLYGEVRQVAVSADGSSVIAGVSEIGDTIPPDTIYYFTRDGKAHWASHGGGWVSGVALSSDGHYAAVGSGRTYYFQTQT